MPYVGIGGLYLAYVLTGHLSAHDREGFSVGKD